MARDESPYCTAALTRATMRVYSGPVDPYPARRHGMTEIAPITPPHIARVYPAGAFRVHVGANLGDAIGGPECCEPGDIYRLARDAAALQLALFPESSRGGIQRIAAGSQIGKPGDPVRLLSRMTLMAEDGDSVQVLVLRHLPSGQDLILPLSPLVARLDYTLIEIAQDVSDLPATDMACAAFAAGTRITLPDGALIPVERLSVGDTVLTRDHGAQAIRWIGKVTLRALGPFAPVVIPTEHLGNLGELVVSPFHRIFLYQRGPDRVGGCAEVLVQARHLVDDDQVCRREGGYVDYYSLIFDRHEIVYAEGIPVESQMISEMTVARLPPDLAVEIRRRFPGLSHRASFATEIGREELDIALRRALGDIARSGRHAGRD